VRRKTPVLTNGKKPVVVASQKPKQQEKFVPSFAKYAKPQQQPPKQPTTTHSKGGDQLLLLPMQMQSNSLPEGANSHLDEQKKQLSANKLPKAAALHHSGQV